jgi:nucleotide-binding universal stress UspA family protein
MINATMHENRPGASRASRHVLVRYESSPHGRGALQHALELARASNAELTVITVATHERVDIGCASCRHGAAIWNREMRLIAEEELAEAASFVDHDESVAFQVVRGKPHEAIREAATRCNAWMIVLPAEPGRLGARRVSRLAGSLRAGGDWELTVPPAEVAPCA